jgi:hypothetical protein
VPWMTLCASKLMRRMLCSHSRVPLMKNIQTMIMSADEKHFLVIYEGNVSVMRQIETSDHVSRKPGTSRIMEPPDSGGTRISET